SQSLSIDSISAAILMRTAMRGLNSIVIDWSRGERIHFVQSEIPDGASGQEVEHSCEGEIHGLKKSQSKKISEGWRRGGSRWCDTVRKRSDAGAGKANSEG